MLCGASCESFFFFISKKLSSFFSKKVCINSIIFYLILKSIEVEILKDKMHLLIEFKNCKKKNYTLK
jgi:hypothetical protein